MSLTERVHVARRYQRAIRLETDVRDPSALEGFICPKSSSELLDVMARHILETGQGAFTWTGPYGGGKSSLAVVLGMALGDSETLRHGAAQLLGTSVTRNLNRALPAGKRGWRILAVTGRRDRPAQVIGEALEAQGFMKRRRAPKTWSEKHLLETVTSIALKSRSSGGLVIFVDELGKFLEGAARDGTDIHFFQDLAELASRSNRRLLVVGILHQAFEEYSHRLSSDMRDEWAKIQGRFIDLPVNADGHEQIDLLSRAIESDGPSAQHRTLARETAALVQGNASPHLSGMLAECWPLHPVTACLLGPLSRRRFGQNQRSPFGFLNSAEPHGFRDFLNRASDDDLYGPDLLWDYLQVNLEPAILVSSDGHRWALAVDALGRCGASGGNILHERLIKVIALADLLKDRSRLPANDELLAIALPQHERKEIRSALKQLRDWSLVTYRKFSESWAVFEGSDFDIDHALEEALEDTDQDVIEALDAFTTLQPMMAKRHYHETGAMRWFDVGVAPLSELARSLEGYKPSRGTIGRFLLALPTQTESKAKAEKLCREAVRVDDDITTVIGLSAGAWSIPGLARELSALERVRDDNPELLGDRVARTEVDARIAAVRERIDIELDKAFESASWYWHGVGRALRLSRVALSEVASELADRRFFDAPQLHNELLGRVKPSGNAVAARNALMRRMVVRETKENLGIESFPAERGLYASVLKQTRLHRQRRDGIWHFVAPRHDTSDTSGLAPLWKAARALLRSNAGRTVPLSEIYRLWRDRPFGVKEGFLPVLTLAFMLSERSTLAFYREGVFQAQLSDLDVDYLARDPRDIQLRWMKLGSVSRDLLSSMAGVVRDLDETNDLKSLVPIDVARGLVAIHDRLEPWVGRTQQLSRNALAVRQIFKQARDPNRLIFDDLPKLLAGSGNGADIEATWRITARVRDGLMELREAYPAMLARLREILLAELRVPSMAPAMLAELRERATNIRHLGGDHRHEAFIMRVEAFQGTERDMEELAGLAAGKPVSSWVDTDVEQATIALADLARRFVHVEAFAHVKGRRDKRQAMAVVVGLDGVAMPMHAEFQVTDRDLPAITALTGKINGLLGRSHEADRHIVLAALASVSARYLGDGSDSASLGPHREKRNTQ
ncbi:MAG: ATP-binding protein [bacterium]|nr:ATP-binding protein [bacterium]